MNKVRFLETVRAHAERVRGSRPDVAKLHYGDHLVACEWDVPERRKYQRRKVMTVFWAPGLRFSGCDAVDSSFRVWRHVPAKRRSMNMVWVRSR